MASGQKIVYFGVNFCVFHLFFVRNVKKVLPFFLLHASFFLPLPQMFHKKSKVAPLALPVGIFTPLLSHTHIAIAPHAPSARARSLASSHQAKAWLAWLGMVWYGLASDLVAFIMKCGDTCRHNISK